MVNVEKTCKNIKRKREDLGFTTWKFAKKMGVSYSTAVSWETKTVPNIDNLFAMSKCFGCTIEDLVVYE